MSGLESNLLSDEDVDSILERFDLTDRRVQRETMALLIKRLADLEAFKLQVDDWLDAMNVPSDPHPELTQETGWTIESRLNFVEQRLAERTVCTLPGGIEIIEPNRSQVRRADRCFADPVVGFTMNEGDAHVAYARSADNSMIYLGRFDIASDAIQAILRCAGKAT